MATVYVWNRYNATVGSPVTTNVNKSSISGSELSPLRGHTLNLISYEGGIHHSNGYIVLGYNWYNQEDVRGDAIGNGTIGTSKTISFTRERIRDSDSNDRSLGLIVDNDLNKCIAYFYCLNDDLAFITGSITLGSDCSVSWSYSIVDGADSPTVHRRALTISSWNYTKGSLSGTVESENRSAYPDNAVSGNYWYVYSHSYQSGPEAYINNGSIKQVQVYAGYGGAVRECDVYICKNGVITKV